MKIFCANASKDLAKNIAKAAGVQLAQSLIKKFSDGETWVEVQENVRGQDVFVVQSTSCPANDHLMELLILIDALKRASAKRITAVIPYYGYARQDRKVAPRTPITSKLVADLIEAAGANRILSMDLHAGQIQGFFNIPFDHLYAKPVLIDCLKKLNEKDLVLVSPDAGGVERARSYAKHLDATLAIIDKRREVANESQVMNLIGEVKGKTAIILDDIIDTAGTTTQAVPVLLERGAKKVYAVAVHPVLSGPAVSRIEQSGLEKVFVTDTVMLSKEAQKVSKIEVVSVAKLLGDAILRIHSEDSVSSLFI